MSAVLTPGRAVVIAIVAVYAAGGARLEAQYPRGMLAAPDVGCTIETRPVVFGAYDSLSSQARDAQGSVIYTCGSKSDRTPIKNLRIELSAGGAGSYNRAMSAGSTRLLYNLYMDAERRTVWGNGGGGSTYYFDPSPPNKTPVTVTVYGRIPGMQDVSAGEYSDMLQIKILF